MKWYPLIDARRQEAENEQCPGHPPPSGDESRMVVVKFVGKLTNLGIVLSLHSGDGPKPLQPAADARQDKPRKSYVYAHVDSEGKIFYVGKGEGRRAWSKERHFLWHRYVETHLGGKFQVQILQDNLSRRKAEELEAEWISQHSDNLVNWINMGRTNDYESLVRYHKLRGANRDLIQRAKATEKSDLVCAVEMYIQAIDAISRYAFVSHEKGLVGQLLNGDFAECGKNGEIDALDRLTLCLIRLHRPTEAAQRAKDYFALYRRDLQLRTTKRIAQRIDKAVQ